jgi:hypothetical protein
MAYVSDGNGNSNGNGRSGCSSGGDGGGLVVAKEIANANSWGGGKELTINYQNAKKW